MDDDDSQLKLLKKQVHLFIQLKFPAHIDLFNGEFYNGYIVKLSADFFILDDVKIGKTPIFFQQIRNIERYNDKKGENG